MEKIKKQIKINSKIFDYTIYKTDRKSISIEVKNCQIVVRSNKVVSIKNIETLILKNKDILFYHIDRQRENLKKNYKTLHIFGKIFRIIKETTENKNSYYEIKDNEVIFFINNNNGTQIDEINKLNEKIYKDLCNDFITKRVENLVKKTGLIPKKVTFKNMKTRWGSCSSKGNISININLCKFDYDIIDYVIIHELCHLEQMNHSKLFWNLVEKNCSNYKQLKYNLKNI